ncbi:hypothetical protein JCM5353_006540 [Sporobolomyces roseus]
MYFVPPPPPLESDVSPSATRSSTNSRNPSTPATKPRSNARREPSELSLSDPVGSLTKILTKRRYFSLVAGCLLLWESFLVVAIILKVPYTEIDFKTYLQQASIFMVGERDYSLLKGDTGPCVYPAGHIYAYSALYYITDAGRHLQRAQWLFGAVYIATLALVFSIYQNSRKVPPYALIFLTLSKRIHSLYVLRLFNDCLAMLFLYSALWMYTRPTKQGGLSSRKWIIGTCLFSLALSIKMSILLFLPALSYLIFVYHSPLAFIQHSLLLVSSQIVLASPFLTSLPLAKQYFLQAFDFNREFLWEWTVNWRWLGGEVFEDPAFGKVLLMLHAAGLGVMAVRWSEEEGGVVAILKRAWKNPGSSPARASLTSNRTATLFFTSNLLGVLCARSLHYQFYVWFYHSLVWLLWETWDGLEIDVMQRLVFASLIEFGFHSFPSTVNSSLGLVLSLLIILGVGWYGKPAGEQGKPIEKPKGE